MGVSRSFHFEPKVFAAGELSSGVAEVLRRTFTEGSSIDLSILRTLADGTKQTLLHQPFQSLSSICDLAEERASLSMDFGQPEKHWGGVIREARILFTADEDGYLSAYVETATPELLQNFGAAFQEELHLISAPPARERAKTKIEEGGDALPPMMQLIEDLTERVAVLERQHSDRRQPLTCFLSFQFTGAAVEYARQVRYFLELLDVRVITGQGFEPKPINEKVRDRLKESLDFVVVIDVQERKSAWTRDEMARAQQPGTLLIPLVEQGATFDRGIFGDHEYIEFAPGHIGDAFTGLLEGVLYVRRVIQDRLTALNLPNA